MYRKRGGFKRGFKRGGKRRAKVSYKTPFGGRGILR